MNEKVFKVSFLVLLSSVLFVFFGCSSAPEAKQDETEQVQKEQQEQDQKSYDKDICERYLSFAWSYYDNGNWDRAIKNFERMIDEGCAEAYASDIYYDMGRAYMKKSEYDSATSVFLEGLEYLPKDQGLRENLAYCYGRLDQTAMQLSEYEKLAKQYPEEVKYLRRVVKLSLNTNDYRKAVKYCDKILDIKPGNDEAISDKMTAMKKMGKDVITVVKDSWESNQTVSNGLDYANALKEREKYQQAISVYREVLNINRENFEAWNSIANCYFNMGRVEQGIQALKNIVKKVSPRDIATYEKIVNKYIDLGEYEKALKWAKNAVEKKKSALTYQLVGDVYYQTAENVRGSSNPSFEDKLVYKLAYDYYKKAIKQGNSGLGSRMDRLEEYLIPTKQDWFMNRYNEDGSERTNYEPRKQAYKWIDEQPKQS